MQLDNRENLIFSDRVLSEMINNFRGYTEYKLYYAAKYSQSATVARVVSRLLAEAFSGEGSKGSHNTDTNRIDRTDSNIHKESEREGEGGKSTWTRNF